MGTVFFRQHYVELVSVIIFLLLHIAFFLTLAILNYYNHSLWVVHQKNY